MLWAHYLFRFTPLDIYLQTRGLGRPFADFRFGETPWFTGAEILREAGVGPTDQFVDLGCGRGKMVFLAHLLCGCQAVGIDLLPGYIYVAQRMTRWLGLRGRVSFQGCDFAEVDLTAATVIYVAGSIFAEETRADLNDLLDSLRAGAQWISVTWPWQHPRLELESRREYLFSWGWEWVYRYRVTDPDGAEPSLCHPDSDVAADAQNGPDCQPETEPTESDSIDP